MSKLLEPPMLIVGIGNELRHDDAAGLMVARKISERLEPGPDLTIMESDGDGNALLDAWRYASSVILIDSVSSGVDAGTIHYFDVHEQKLPADIFSSSTHVFSVIDAIEQARLFDELPPMLIVYGIEGQIFAPGIGLSPRVQQTIDMLSALLGDWVASFRPHLTT